MSCFDFFRYFVESKSIVCIKHIANKHPHKKPTRARARQQRQPTRQQGNQPGNKATMATNLPATRLPTRQQGNTGPEHATRQQKQPTEQHWQQRNKGNHATRQPNAPQLTSSSTRRSRITVATITGSTQVTGRADRTPVSQTADLVRWT